MICEFCGGRTTIKKVRKQHWLNNKLYLIENAPAEVCTECGERYFSAETLDKIDEMLLQEHSVKERIEVEIVSLEELIAA